MSDHIHDIKVKPKKGHSFRLEIATNKTVRTDTYYKGMTREVLCIGKSEIHFPVGTDITIEKKKPSEDVDDEVES